MEVIRSLAAKNPSIHAVSFSRNYGKSPALNTGFARANGDVVITMDADLQDSPDEIPELYRMIAEEGYDLVSGWKKKRYDPLSKTIPTKLFNATARKVSGIKNLHDFNCGLKAYRNIDGEEYPSLNGTGTEDYFNHAWGMQRNAYPFFG